MLNQDVVIGLLQEMKRKRKVALKAVKHCDPDFLRSNERPSLLHALKSPAKERGYYNLWIENWVQGFDGYQSAAKKLQQALAVDPLNVILYGAHSLSNGPIVGMAAFGIENPDEKTIYLARMLLDTTEAQLQSEIYSCNAGMIGRMELFYTRLIEDSQNDQFTVRLSLSSLRERKDDVSMPSIVLKYVSKNLHGRSGFVRPEEDKTLEMVERTLKKPNSIATLVVYNYISIRGLTLNDLASISEK